MINDHNIRDEILQFKINRDAAKILALSTSKIDQRKIIKEAKFTYSPLGKSFEKQIKTIEDQVIKKVEALKALKSDENQDLESTEGIFPKKMKNNEIKNERDDIKKLEEKVKLEDLIYGTY